MEVIHEKENKLLNRKEIKALIKKEEAATTNQVTKILSEKLKSSEETIALKNMKGKFGTNDFLIEAHIYKSKEHKEKIEPKKRGKK